MEGEREFGICQMISVQYCSYRKRLGLGRDLFELINCAGTFTAVIFLICYFVSLCHKETYKNVRNSFFVSYYVLTNCFDKNENIQEVLLTFTCSVLYIIASAMMKNAVYEELHFIYYSDNSFIEYHIFTAVYVSRTQFLIIFS